MWNIKFYFSSELYTRSSISATESNDSYMPLDTKTYYLKKSRAHYGLYFKIIFNSTHNVHILIKGSKIFPNFFSDFQQTVNRRKQ